MQGANLFRREVSRSNTYFLNTFSLFSEIYFWISSTIADTTIIYKSQKRAKRSFGSGKSCDVTLVSPGKPCWSRGHRKEFITGVEKFSFTPIFPPPVNPGNSEDMELSCHEWKKGIHE
jgi:hypothetical protein